MLESAQSHNLGFEELRVLIEGSPQSRQLIALLLFHRRYRPREWAQCLALLQWISAQKDIPPYLAVNASLSLIHTALFTGDYDAARIADSDVRKMLGRWEELSDHSRTGKRDRTHLFFSHVTVSWPLAFLAGSVDDVVKELDRGREFFLGLDQNTLQRPVYARTIQNVSRIVLADSTFAFVRKDFLRVNENFKLLRDAFNNALLIMPKNEQVRTEFLKSTATLEWGRELIRHSKPPDGQVAEWLLESHDVVRGSFKLATRVRGQAVNDVFKRFSAVLSTSYK